MIEGHKVRLVYLQEQDVRELLGKKADLCKEAYAELLGKVKKAFTDSDNDIPTMKYTKEEITKHLIGTPPRASTASPSSSTISSRISWATKCWP